MLSNWAFLSLLAKLLGVSAELHGWAQESWVSSSGKELYFGLGSITSPLCAIIFTTISLSALIFALLQSAKSHLPFAGAAGVLWTAFIDVPAPLGAKCCALTAVTTSRPGCPKLKCSGSVSSKPHSFHGCTSLKASHLLLNVRNNNAKLLKRQ